MPIADIAVTFIGISAREYEAELRSARLIKHTSELSKHRRPKSRETGNDEQAVDVRREA